MVQVAKHIVAGAAVVLAASQVTEAALIDLPMQPGEQVLFQDDFTNSNAGWSLSNSTVQDGEMGPRNTQILNGASEAEISFASPSDLSAGTIRVYFLLRGDTGKEGGRS